jgi:hypothetical protein
MSIQQTTLQVVNFPSKIGEEREYHINAEMIVNDDNISVKLKDLEKVLKEFTKIGLIQYIVYEDIANFGKILKIKRMK